MAKLDAGLSRGLVARESSAHQIRRPQLEMMTELLHHLGFDGIAIAQTAPERARTCGQAGDSPLS
jgi:hypothetical protein